jgi:crotonobetainyl-CoA:carnitine CoA-transferase CaiB-like acyl-CoA transferase
MSTTNDTFSAGAQQALNGLLGELGMTDRLGVSEFCFTGEEPPLATPHRITMAAAVATAAAAAGAARRWSRSGQPAQTLTVDSMQAACSLNPANYQRQHGFRMPALSLARELKAAFYETADGRWFFPIGSYPHLRDGVLALLGCPNTEQALAAAIKGRHSDELEESFHAHGLPGVHARSSEEWRQHPQGRALALAPVISIEKIADSAPEPGRPQRRPLDDLRVLDVSHVIAGPATARTLGEHGAEVLRISSPLQPDPIPQILDTGIGKRNAYLDLQVPDDLTRFRGLAERADVFVQSWRTGSLDARGLGPVDLARLRPGIIYVSVNAFGFEGPWANRKGFEQLGQAASGIAITEGEHAGTKPRVVPTYLLNDYLTAYLAAAGAMAALDRRATEGGSYHVKVSLARTSMWVQSLGLAALPASPCSIDDLSPDLQTRSSPFGMLEQLAPVARLSATPAHWSLPPAPLGSDAPVWRS